MAKRIPARDPTRGRETSGETSGNSLQPALAQQSHGGALLTGGVPGHRGAGGRPREEFRRRCREALEQAGGLEFLVRVVRGEEMQDAFVTVGTGINERVEIVRARPKLRDRLFAAQLLIEQGYGKPPQKLEVETPERLPTFDEAIARMTELLPTVLPFLPVEKRVLVAALERRRRIAVPAQAREVKP